MAYNGKTDWVNNEIVEAVDMNRIEQGITDLDVGKMNNDGTGGELTQLEFANGGIVTYNPDTQILDIANPDGSVMNVGKELWVVGKTTEFLLNGDIAQYAGTQGDFIKIKKAVPAEIDANPSLLLGICTTPTLTNQWVKVTRYGEVNNINTSAFLAGDLLYFDPVNGGLTKTEPVNGYPCIELAAVQKVDSNVGILMVGVNNKTIKAKYSRYDNSVSGLAATNTQDAIDELRGKVFDIQDNAGFHNSIYRGKYLGSSVTAAQYAAISAGTFEDLYIGDYWTIGGVNYRIAAFNYYYNTGDSPFTMNHLVIVPDTVLYSHVMNDINIVTGAYVGSKMYISGLNSAKTIINSAFSGHIRTHRNYLHNAVTSGYASGGAWFDSEIELMTEANVYGTKHYGNAMQGTNLANNVYVDKSQFPLFALNPQSINIRQSYWLRDVASPANFAFVNNRGNSDHTYASNSYGVRPAFCIS